LKQVAGNSGATGQRSRDSRKALGAFAERLAAVELARRGYRIVARNVNLRVGEIDIVAVKDGTTVLVEVRARREGALGSPFESLTAAKQRRMVRAAETFISLHPELPQEARIDFVAVTLSSRGIVRSIEILENAVEG
jgi:putative endonuclease